MEMDLRNIEWGEFVFEKVFCIFSTNSGIDKNKLNNKKGNIPYITRTDRNNAIDFFVGDQDVKYNLDNSNVITIGLDTQTVFYQSYKFYTGQNIQILSNNCLNFYNAQFLIPLIKKQMEKFNWGGNGATLSRLKRSKLILPVDNNGEPDYAFMELCMRQKEQKKLAKFKSYIEDRINKVSDFLEIEPLSQKEWGEFKLKDLFSFEKGNQNDMANLTSGKTPLVSAKNGENGLKGFVMNKNKRLFLKNCLTLNNDGDGGAGISYYQPYDFLLDSHVTALYPRWKLSEYTLLFISRCITKQRNKFGHGYSLTNKRLNSFKLMFPINHLGAPDYDYMENYIKKIEYEKLTKYLKIKTFG